MRKTRNLSVALLDDFEIFDVAGFKRTVLHSTIFIRRSSRCKRTTIAARCQTAERSEPDSPTSEWRNPEGIEKENRR
jgi:hypothetical protein